MSDAGAGAKPMLSEKVFLSLKRAILNGEYRPGNALKPQELAKQHQVSLAVMRESLLRAVGEGLADRLPNRGFAVPECTDERWIQIVEARRTVEPRTLRLAIERGDLEWEARVRAAHHRLSRTPLYDDNGGRYFSDTWSEAHRGFHRSLLEGCGNDVLLETFDRMWTASELARRWSVHKTPGRDFLAEHRRIEEAALARDADEAASLLERHLSQTAAGLRSHAENANETAA